MEILPKIHLYHVDHLIAKGGTAAVYFGVDLRSGYPVAIKSLYPNRAANPYILRKFREGANLYLYLAHKNLTRLVDFVVDGDKYYIIMEYIEGDTLEHIIQTQSHPFSTPKIIDIFNQILSTIAYLHQHGVLHLDIKPNNIMIKPDGTVKVIDMGISIHLKEREIKAVGTPPFMSPEQQDGSNLGFYTDIFALGVTLFNMVTGQLPFTGSATDVLISNRNAVRPLVTQIYPYANSKFQPIIERAMNPNPRLRYQTCEEMMMDLQKINNNI